MNNLNVTSKPMRSSAYVAMDYVGQDKSAQQDFNLELPAKLMDLQQKLIKGELTADELDALDDQLEIYIKVLPIELQEQFQRFNQDCADVVKSSRQQLKATTNANEHEQITNGALNSIAASASGMKDYMSRLEMNLLLPFSVISMQVLSSSGKVMADQAKLALDKMEAMTKLIEKLQAMTTLMTSLNNVLNSEFSRQKTLAAQQKDTSIDPGNENNLDWDAASRYHGQAVDHNNINISKMCGGYGMFGWSKDHLKNSPIGKFLYKYGFLADGATHWGPAIEAGSGPVVPGPNLDKNGCFDYNKLTNTQKNEFDEAMRIDGLKNLDEVDGKTIAHYGDAIHGSFSTDTPDFYDADGKKIVGGGTDDPAYKNSIFFSIDQIPESLRSEFTGICSSGAAPHTITHYAISKEQITKVFSKLIGEYSSVMGETPDDFNAKLSEGVTGTIKQLDNISKIMQQKIQYIQQKQAALAKTPENAKEDGNRKLDMFNNLLRSTSY